MFMMNPLLAFTALKLLDCNVQQVSADNSDKPHTHFAGPDEVQNTSQVCFP